MNTTKNGETYLFGNNSGNETPDRNMTDENPEN